MNATTFSLSLYIQIVDLAYGQVAAVFLEYFIKNKLKILLHFYLRRWSPMPNGTVMLYHRYLIVKLTNKSLCILQR